MINMLFDDTETPGGIILTMNHEHIDKLIFALKDHKDLKNFDMSNIYKTLENTLIEKNDVFEEDLYAKNNNPLKIIDTNINSKFSLVKLLRNDNISKYAVEKKQRKVEKKELYKNGTFPIRVVLENLTQDGSVEWQMNNSIVPYSLLGKVETSEYSVSENGLKIQKKPILIVGGVSNYDAIHSWENKNIIRTFESDSNWKSLKVTQVNDSYFN